MPPLPIGFCSWYRSPRTSICIVFLNKLSDVGSSGFDSAYFNISCQYFHPFQEFWVSVTPAMPVIPASRARVHRLCVVLYAAHPYALRAVRHTCVLCPAHHAPLLLSSCRVPADMPPVWLLPHHGSLAEKARHRLV